MNPFDDEAATFARAIDQALQGDGYVRGRLVLDLAARTIPASSLVLDYGCGPGRLSLLLARAGFRVRAVDISAGMIAEALKLDHQGVDLAFEIISVSQAVLQPGCCDAILCSSVIEYVLDPDELLRSFRRALRPSGVLIISYANRSSLWRAYLNSGGSEANPMYVPHHHTWHWREFRKLLVRHGVPDGDRAEVLRLTVRLLAVERVISAFLLHRLACHARRAGERGRSARVGNLLC